MLRDQLQAERIDTEARSSEAQSAVIVRNTAHSGRHSIYDQPIYRITMEGVGWGFEGFGHICPYGRPIANTVNFICTAAEEYGRDHADFSSTVIHASVSVLVDGLVTTLFLPLEVGISVGRIVDSLSPDGNLQFLPPHMRVQTGIGSPESFRILAKVDEYTKRMISAGVVEFTRLLAKADEYTTQSISARFSEFNRLVEQATANGIVLLPGPAPIIPPPTALLTGREQAEPARYGLAFSPWESINRISTFQLPAPTTTTDWVMPDLQTRIGRDFFGFFAPRLLNQARIDFTPPINELEPSVIPSKGAVVSRQLNYQQLQQISYRPPPWLAKQTSRAAFGGPRVTIEISGNLDVFKFAAAISLPFGPTSLVIGGIYLAGIYTLEHLAIKRQVQHQKLSNQALSDHQSKCQSVVDSHYEKYEVFYARFEDLLQRPVDEQLIQELRQLDNDIDREGGRCLQDVHGSTFVQFKNDLNKDIAKLSSKNQKTVKENARNIRETAKGECASLGNEHFPKLHSTVTSAVADATKIQESSNSFDSFCLVYGTTYDEFSLVLEAYNSLISIIQRQMEEEDRDVFSSIDQLSKLEDKLNRVKKAFEDRRKEVEDYKGIDAYEEFVDKISNQSSKAGKVLEKGLAFIGDIDGLKAQAHAERYELREARQLATRALAINKDNLIAQYALRLTERGEALAHSFYYDVASFAVKTAMRKLDPNFFKKKFSERFIFTVAGLIEVGDVLLHNEFLQQAELASYTLKLFCVPGNLESSIQVEKLSNWHGRLFALSWSGWVTTADTVLRVSDQYIDSRRLNQVVTGFRLANSVMSTYQSVTRFAQSFSHVHGIIISALNMVALFSEHSHSFLNDRFRFYPQALSEGLGDICVSGVSFLFSTQVYPINLVRTCTNKMLTESISTTLSYAFNSALMVKLLSVVKQYGNPTLFVGSLVRLGYVTYQNKLKCDRGKDSFNNYLNTIKSIRESIEKCSEILEKRKNRQDGREKEKTNKEVDELKKLDDKFKEIQEDIEERKSKDAYQIYKAFGESEDFQAELVNLNNINQDILTEQANLLLEEKLFENKMALIEIGNRTQTLLFKQCVLHRKILALRKQFANDEKYDEDALNNQAEFLNKRKQELAQQELKLADELEGFDELLRECKQFCSATSQYASGVTFFSSVETATKGSELTTRSLSITHST